MHPLFNKKQHFCLLFWINQGTNPISYLEVVSLLNIPSQAHDMYLYNTGSCLVKYNPKIYLGTIQTIAQGWIYDNQKGINYPSIWPEKGPQKGEANTEGLL